MQRTVSNTFKPVSYESIDHFYTHFDVEKPSSAIQIEDNLPIQMRWVNRNSETTLVIFSAAITRRAATEVPIFSGWNTTKHLSVNLLMISDPSLILHSDLNLAWYVGSQHQPLLMDSITRIMKVFAKTTRLIFFGASGGGYAALSQACRLPGSTAVVSNPQTDIRRFSYYPEFMRLAWPGHEDPHYVVSSSA